MQTVGEFVTHVSTQMHDQRHGRAFIRWGRGLLLEYLNLGLTEIGTYRPEAFAADETLTLVPGATQSIDPSKTLVAISANTDGTPVLSGDVDMATAYNAYAVCVPEPRIINGVAHYLVRSYSIDKKNSHKFYVDPPVPKGMTVQVTATVSGNIPQYTLADWNKAVEMESKFDANLVQYMLASAHSLDRESAQARQTSGDYYNRFYASMGVKYKQESRYKSGFYLGEIGTGDPQAGNR